MPLLSKTRSPLSEKSALRMWLPLGGALLLSLAAMPSAPAQSGKGGGSALAESELTKRLQAQERAQLLVVEGDSFAAKGNHCDAADRYRDAATALLPGARSTEALRADAVRKFAKSGVICAREQAATGSYEQGKARLTAML